MNQVEDLARTVNELLAAVHDMRLDGGEDSVRIAIENLKQRVPLQADLDPDSVDKDERTKDVVETAVRVATNEGHIQDIYSKLNQSVLLDDDTDGVFLARIDHEDGDGGGEYDQWTEMEIDAAGLFKARVGGRTEATDSMSIWESHDVEDIPINTVVRVHTQQGDLLQYNFECPAGGWSGCPVGSVVLWALGVSTIPTGWALCDGQSHSGTTTIDLRGRFVVGYQASGGMNNYDTPGSVAGQNLHGATSNNHPIHDLEHLHTDVKDVAAGVDEGVDASGVLPVWTGDAGLTPDVNHYINHGGWMNADGTTAAAPTQSLFTDNRPPYYVAVFIQKIA